MIVKKITNIKTTIIIFFICLTSFMVRLSFVYPEDLRKDFEVVSPKYVQQVNYIREEPSFKITAPKDWYMAMNKNEAEKMGEPRVVFCKYDPEPDLATGSFGMPFIEIKFWPNQDKKSSLVWANDIVSGVEKRGVKALLAPEAIKIKTYKATHFKMPHPSGSLISDFYMIEGNGYFVSVIAYYEPDKDIEDETKEAINSIEF